jgi:hypothetical protein
MKGVYLPKPFQVISEIRETKKDRSGDSFPVVKTAKRILRSIDTNYNNFLIDIEKDIKKKNIIQKNRRKSLLKKSKA